MSEKLRLLELLKNADQATKEALVMVDEKIGTGASKEDILESVKSAFGDTAAELCRFYLEYKYPDGGESLTMEDILEFGYIDEDYDDDEDDDDESKPLC